MRKSISAGGVVFLNDDVLLLMKKNGMWVLPKGRIEVNEHRSQTALREVLEEADVSATIHEYLGSIHYQFQNIWSDYELEDKIVHWYLMTTGSRHCVPLAKEGFRDADFIMMDKALEMAAYNDERKIIKKAIALYREKSIFRRD